MSRDPGDIQSGPPDDYSRRFGEDRGRDYDRDRDYDRGRDYDRDPYDRRDFRRPPEESGELSPGDWVLCVLCPGIGCIVGIVRAVNGNATGGKMIGFSILFAVLWNIIRFVFLAGMRP